jgi:hypothetical protein
VIWHIGHRVARPLDPGLLRLTFGQLTDLSLFLRRIGRLHRETSYPPRTLYLTFVKGDDTYLIVLHTNCQVRVLFLGLRLARSPTMHRVLPFRLFRLPSDRLELNRRQHQTPGRDKIAFFAASAERAACSAMCVITSGSPFVHS